METRLDGQANGADLQTKIVHLEEKIAGQAEEARTMAGDHESEVARLMSSINSLEKRLEDKRREMELYKHRSMRTCHG